MTNAHTKKFETPLTLEAAILEYYLKGRVPASAERLKALEEMGGAPEVIVEQVRRNANADHWKAEVPAMIAAANKFGRLDSKVINVTPGKTYKGQPCLVFEKESFTQASKRCVTLLLNENAVKNGDASY